jgi:EmrB/QacA subfamily drug resistance transporter
VITHILEHRAGLRGLLWFADLLMGISIIMLALQAWGSGTIKNWRPSKKMLLLTGLMIAMFLSALDQTLFGTALPTIAGELHGVQHQQWVTTAYLLAMVIVLPAYGKLGDQLGYRRLFLLAIGLFIGGSIVGALTPNMTWLIIGRAIQGIGGGGLMVLAMSILGVSLTMKERAGYSWMFAVVFSVPSLIGPTLGGFLTDPHNVYIFGLVTNWRWTFWLNVPLGLLAFAAAWAFVRIESPKTGKPKIDYLGIVLLALASSMIVFATSWGGSTYPWGSKLIIGLFMGAIVFFVLYVFAERRASSNALMPGWLFRNRNFVLVAVAGMVLGVVMMGTLAYLPTYIQMVTGKSATTSGYHMLPMVLAMVVTSTIVGQIARRTGRYKWSPITGMAISAVALYLLSTMTPETQMWHFWIYVALIGVGLGMSMSILQLIVQNSVEPQHMGTAVSTNTYFRTMGMSLGAAVVGTLFVSNLKNQLAVHFPGMALGSGGQGSFTPAALQALPPEMRTAIISSYGHALTPVFLWIILPAAVAFLLLLFVREDPLSDTVEGMATADSLEVDGMGLAVLPPEVVKTRRQQLSYKGRHRVK